MDIDWGRCKVEMKARLPFFLFGFFRKNRINLAQQKLQKFLFISQQSISLDFLKLSDIYVQGKYINQNKP